jgi:hypothetical protein
MKNYLVKSLFKVTDPDWKIAVRANEPNMYKNYVKMHQLSMATYKKFLPGDWELKFVSGVADHINQAFEKTFWFIHDLWHKEPCNILYTDPDTLAIKPLDFWDQYSNFMMFNHTDPKQFNAKNIYNKQFDHFFNAGVRYFPSSMSQDIWNTATEMAKSWDSSTYDTEQIILNTMLWNQNVTINQVRDPTTAFQIVRGTLQECEEWNGCKLTDARIVHFHSSRDSNNRVNVMQEMYNQLHIT